MTIILHDQKLIILKTFKTGSTSLHLYFDDLAKERKNIKITNKYHGHDTLDDLNFIFPEPDFREYTVIAYLRYPVQYINSVFNQYIYETESKNSRSLRWIRRIFKINKRLAFIVFYNYYCIIRRKKTNIVNANYNLIKSYQDCKKIIILPYPHFNFLKYHIKYFCPKKFKTYQERKYVKIKDKNIFKQIPLRLRLRIIKQFEREIKLSEGFRYEEVFKKYN